jgi:flagellar motility protein MotE (MotC chaperone)
MNRLLILYPKCLIALLCFGFSALANDSEDSLILKDLAVLKLKLEERSKQLESRENELNAREKMLEEQMKELKRIRDEIERLNSSAKTQDESKISKIVETLEKMSPKAGAAVLSVIDESLAVEVYGRISSDKLAKILAQLDPEKASRLGERYAGVIKLRESKR